MEGILPEARPIFQLPVTARLAVFSQAPGNLAHQGGKPFLDPSGVRLRSWMGMSEAEFYDSGRLAIVPMAFCFPGYDGTGKTGKGGDLPPPKVCAERWREQVMELLLPQLRVILLVGRYAMNWHLPEEKRRGVRDIVSDWQQRFDQCRVGGRLVLPLPHPSWRNTAWLRKNPWFEEEVVPRLQEAIQKAVRD
ncbi:MAG: uracil-DNA glycosylase family protein [Pseudomonadota bacterium]